MSTTDERLLRIANEIVAIEEFLAAESCRTVGG